MGRGWGIPWGRFMRDARKSGVDPLNPTPLRVVGHGTNKGFSGVRETNYDSDDENEGSLPGRRGGKNLEARGQQVKLHIPEFDRKADADAFMNWLNRVDKILAYKRYGDPKTVLLFETKLNDYALNWWDNLQKMRADAGFILMSYEDDSFTKLQGLRQKLKTLTASGVPDEKRKAEMDSVNPKYVLRNYLCQSAIDAAEQGDYGELHRLQKVMERPYDEQAGMEKYARLPPAWAYRPGVCMLSCSS
ncbi:hypothetical protein GIB67_010376 [Kingdonia uniflora]|uniref:Selenoprotein O n=1 Tax=Kingdonia uniflora TaxID=39325 RepID=A0A7J7MAE4_9MAGN|nr:hypothetical protein GIB67_010376 [Kingdonia uniflora]